MEFYGQNIKSLSIEKVCTRIQYLTNSMMSFWKNAHGWAPSDAANLMNNSKLEHQISLSKCLSKWLGGTTTGELILAWANLGSLVEGQLKLFLCVFYNDYFSDEDAIKKKGYLQNPDILMFGQLRQFFVKKIWDTSSNWDKWLNHIQKKRNAIHGFKECNIGDFDMWRQDLRNHLVFIKDINLYLPYPA